MAVLPRPADISAAPAIEAAIAGNRLLLIETGAERMAILLKLIDGARESLSLLFYMFRDDACGLAVRNALVEAAGRGVRVRLLLDGFGSADTDPDFFAPLVGQGGELCMFHPSYGRRYMVRNHQKLVVADGRQALIGGANIQEDYLTDDGPKHWRDLWLVIDGPAVGPAADYFDALFRWTSTKGAKLRSLRRIVRRYSQSEGPLQWQFTGPLSRRSPWPFAFGRALLKARRMDMIAAYFSPPRSMLRRIGRLARRGEVRIITAAKSDNEATIAAARHSYSRLLKRGVQMFEYQPARLHTKLAIVDDAVHIGSANFDQRSVYINLELVLRIEDRSFADAMRRYFEGELADSERITLQLHRRRANPWRRLKWMLSHWLVTTMDYSVTRRLNLGEER